MFKIFEFLFFARNRINEEYSVEHLRVTIQSVISFSMKINFSLVFVKQIKLYILAITNILKLVLNTLNYKPMK